MFNIIVGLPFLWMLWGCGSSDQNGYTLKHEVGQITSGDPRDWVVTTDEIYTLAHPGAKLLPVDHPIVKRIGWWVSWIDSGLRSHPNYQAQMARVPVPELVVSHKYHENAWSSGVPVCYPNIVVSFPGVAGEEVESMEDCLRLPATSVDDVMKIFEDLSTNWSQSSGCDLSQQNISLEDDGTIKVTPPESCKDPDDVNMRGFLGTKTSNRITVDTQLLSQINEQELVATLAHELAHYYRAHQTRAVSYYYVMSDEAIVSRPTPITPASDLWQLTLELDKMRNASARFVDLYNAFSSEFPEFEKTQSPDFKTAATLATVYGISKHELVPRLEKVTSFLTDHIPAPSVKVYVDKILAFLTEWTKEPTDTVEILSRANKARLGWYTIEQEADDVGGEILAVLGFDFGEITDLLLRGDLMKGSCLQRRSSGWMTNGKIEVEPLHRYIDNHHTGCFRVFNIDREKTAHQYQPLTGTKWKELSEVPGWNQLNAAFTWEQIQAKARESVNN
ncbi:MAG: hypothetical protein FJ146_00010 [Deltaproteobacteria bacterium]|nr:hypothetical protein [Deltaproteobacteria bacterium]